MNIAAMTGTVVFSMSPVLEVRGAIPLAIALGLGIWTAFIIALLANIALIPLVFLFLDYGHNHLMKISIYSRTFNLYLNRVRNKAKRKIRGAWPYFALFSLVGLPLPGTGVWTAVLISWFFKMNRKKSFVSIMFGSICVSLIVLLITLGAIKIW